jgi:uncharacterized surface protein with fasciclin (FAS1) repeats
MTRPRSDGASATRRRRFSAEQVVAAAIALTTIAGSACSDGPSTDRSAPSDASTSAPGTTLPSTPSGAHAGAPDLSEVLTQDRFDALQIALERSGLDATLGSLDNFILFAPVQTAFAASGSDIGVDYMSLLGQPQLLDAVLRYHVVADPPTSASWRTLNGAFIDVDTSQSGAIVDVDGTVPLEQIPVRNGLVVALPRVLLPARASMVRDEG